MSKQYAIKRNGQVETGDVVETTIYQTARCSVIQTAYGETLVYRVMSNNNICLFEGASAVKAVEYADWFTAKKEAA
jgi:hypothetical protein